MNKLWLFIITLFLASIFASSSLADNYQLVSPYRVDFNGYVRVVKSNSEQLLLLVENNSLSIPNNLSGKTSFFIYDKYQYFGEIILPSSDKNILIKPIASLSGYVMDDKNNLIKHASLRFVCEDFTSNFPNATDSLGFFSVKTIGFGNCQILAFYNDKVATNDLIINESRQYLVQLVIPNNKETSIFDIIISIVFIVLFILLVWFYITLHKNRKKFTESKIKENFNGGFSKRQDDLLELCNEKEKLIIQEITIKGALTQSQLRFYTGLPKSTLHRTIASLGQKNLVLTTDEGGVKRIKLTDFFLEQN